MAHYVPEPILIIVRRIQRMWRRKMADRERVRNRAARTFQKIYRGNMVRPATNCSTCPSTKLGNSRFLKLMPPAWCFDHFQPSPGTA